MRVSEEHNDQLMKLKKAFRVGSADEVIEVLLREHTEMDTLRDQLKEAQERGDTETPQTSHPCPFYSLVDGLVHCSKDYLERGVVHKVAKSVCDNCWDQQQTAKEIPQTLTITTSKENQDTKAEPIKEKSEKPPCYYAVPQTDGKIRCQNPSKRVRAWQPKDRLITYEDCWGCWHRRKKFVTQPHEEPETKEPTEVEAPPRIVTTPERSLDEIVNDIGVCLNPILMRQRSLLCALCKKRNLAKWQACQEIQKDLENPVQRLKFFKAMTEQAKDPSPMEEISAETKRMTIQQIEVELGIRGPHALTDDDRTFEMVNKRFHELCENCEDLPTHRCTHYCKEFLNGLPEKVVIPRGA